MTQRNLIAMAIMAQTAAICSAAQAAPEAKIDVKRTGMKKTLANADALAGLTRRSTPAFAINVLGKADKINTLEAKYLHQTYADSPQAERAAQEVIAMAKDSALGFNLKNAEPDGSGIISSSKPGGGSGDMKLATSTLWRSAAARAKHPVSGKQLATL